VSRPALDAVDLSVRRGAEAVIDGIDLGIDRGDRVLIRGTSGAGKSTLFAVLALLDTPDGGQLFVDGRDAATLPERERAALRREHVGIVFQDFQLVPDLTARENAALPQDHTGKRDTDWLDELFAHLDIADVARQYPATLSGGERQRVAIARALANRPAVVLADEPTGQLDPETAEDVLDLLVSAQRAFGAGIAVISHDDRVGPRFDRRYELEDGTLTQQ